jgi:hypothetical protein
MPALLRTLREVAVAMAFLHARNILHRDLTCGWQAALGAWKQGQNVHFNNQLMSLSLPAEAERVAFGGLDMSRVLANKVLPCLPSQRLPRTTSPTPRALLGHLLQT